MQGHGGWDVASSAACLHDELHVANADLLQASAGLMHSNESLQARMRSMRTQHRLAVQQTSAGIELGSTEIGGDAPDEEAAQMSAKDGVPWLGSPVRRMLAEARPAWKPWRAAGVQLLPDDAQGMGICNSTASMLRSVVAEGL